MQAINKLVLLSLLLFFSNIGLTIASPDFKMYSYTSKSNKEVFEVVCDNGTTMCNYSWDSLCHEGAAHNSDPDGNETEAPGYIRDPQGIPSRIFICK